MNEVLNIFLIGFAILIVAIIINFIASALGIMTWYTFILSIGENGFMITIKKNALHLLFLIIIYPFILGATGYYLMKLF